MGNNKLMFKPYNKEELMDIIKFKGIDYDKYSDDAIKLCCMKVSAINLFKFILSRNLKK